MILSYAPSRMHHIIFAGTPEFAIPVLDMLLKRKNIKVDAVITQPDQSIGRHHSKVTYSPIKKRALESGITVLQPVKMRDSINELKKIQPTIGIVVAYGQKIPNDILKLPKYGWINVHVSLLPKYRGASPIQSAILNGDPHTGASLMQVETGMDTGGIFAQTEISITEEDTTETLSKKVFGAGAALLDQYLDKLCIGVLTAKPQDENKATHCVKITKEAGLLNFAEKTAQELDRTIRALTPWPGCYTFWNGQRFKIQKASAEKSDHEGKPGTVVAHEKTAAIVCKKGLLIPLIVQKEGKKPVSTEEFLRGNQKFIGTLL